MRQVDPLPRVERPIYLAQSNLLRRTAIASRDISSFD
jgi:hypothetical protein